MDAPTSRRGDADCLHTVLLVDGDSRNTRLLARMLGEDGVCVELAFEGADAVARLARRPLPDALVVELKLRHVDGLAVARHARSLDPSMPILVITGYPHLVGQMEPFDPALEIFPKPLDYARLRSRLLSALADVSPLSRDLRARTAAGLQPMQPPRR